MARKDAQTKNETRRVGWVHWSAAALVMSLGATSANAEGIIRFDPSNVQQERVIKVSAAPKLNLLSGGERRTNIRMTRSTLGNGSYICSPAGFGQKSRCRKN